MKARIVFAALAAVVAFAPVAEAKHFSKLALITAAKQAGKWQAVKAWIVEAGYEDEWLAASYFSDEYPVFSAVTNSVVATGIVTAEEVAAILEAATDTAPDALLDAMYKRDIKTEAGRAKWHGKKTAAPVTDPKNMTQTTTYEDGKVFVDEVKVTTPADSVRQANAKLKTTVTTNGVPKILAEARLQQAKNKEPVEVTVRYVAGQGAQVK